MQNYALAEREANSVKMLLNAKYRNEKMYIL